MGLLDLALSVPLLGVLGTTLMLLTMYGMVVAAYRLFLHPLASFPGPKLASISSAYGAAWDYFGQGSYIFECERMHNKYGTDIPNSDSPFGTILISRNRRAYRAY